MSEIFHNLAKAKENTKWLVDHSDGLADMHGLEYWAGEVVRLRKLTAKMIDCAHQEFKDNLDGKKCSDCGLEAKE